MSTTHNVISYLAARQACLIDEMNIAQAHASRTDDPLDREFTADRIRDLVEEAQALESMMAGIER